MNLQISSFYCFKNLSGEQIAALEATLYPMKLNLRGLIVIGREGLNATVSGEPTQVEAFKSRASDFFKMPIDFKDCWAEKHPFGCFEIQKRSEIVTLGRPDLMPTVPCGHLSAKEWHAALQDPNAVVLDARNDYEVEIGRFKNAIHLRIDEFRDLPVRFEAQGFPKDKKILMYCTGGIRCEKAALAVREQGYANVFQLRGGILEYLREHPNQMFEGECFVFDYRVAVDQNLKPTERYRFCPHCGQPGQQAIMCRQCGTRSVVCRHCLEASADLATCSKNCAYHASIGSKSRNPQLQEQSNRGQPL